MTSPQFDEYLQIKKALVDETLDRVMPSSEEEPRAIHEAMRYSVFAGGKRLRPILAIAAYEIAGAQGAPVLPLACGLELIHTYSLIHDDLPCMDDDDLRRGLPTNHKVYGEGMAVLAGDALLSLAFECFLGRGTEEPLSGSLLATLARKIAGAIGCQGLIGGQVMDIGNYSKDRQLSTLETTCHLKTGRLIEVSLECGAGLAGAGQDLMQALSQYGTGLGMAFQITDDILNVTGDVKKMGKAAKSDAAHDKITFPALLGLEGASQQARRWIAQAKQAIAPLGGKAWFLREMADYVLARQT